MNDLDIKVLELIRNANTINDNILELSRGIVANNDNTVLYEALVNMCKENSDFVRKYIKNNSTIIYQKDIVIDNKENYRYNEQLYNNDSQYFDFVHDRVLVSCDDYAIYSKEYDFYVDIFVNGRRLNENTYSELPSYDKYKFVTGSRRFFIHEELINDGDMVSIVVHKTPKMINSYAVITIRNPEVKTYAISDSQIGNYFGMFENLVLYKYANGIFTKVSRNDYSLLEHLPSNNTDPVTIDLTFTGNISLDDKYYLMNKLKTYKIAFKNTTEYNDEEYLELVPKMSASLITNQGVPLPIDDVNDLEIFIDGFKLINGHDFIIAYDNNNTAYVQFTGILKIDSDVIIRNRCNNNPYSIHKLVVDMPDIYESYEGYPYEISTGIVDLKEYPIPICEDYVEAYLGRRRVPITEKRNLISRFIKIDNQKYTFKNLELRSDFYFTRYMEQLLNNQEVIKEAFSKLHEISAEWVKDAWLYTLVDSGTTDGEGNPIYNQYENNELRPNTQNETDMDGSTIFLDSIYRIELQASPSIITEGRTPSFTVLGYYSDDTNAIDITDYCTFSTFDPNIVGEQTVTATYNQGGTSLTDNIIIEVIYRAIAELKFECNSNFFVVGDPLRNNVKVVAIFEDSTKRQIPLEQLASYDIPEYAGIPDEATGELQPGGMILSATYQYNNIVKHAEHAILVASSNERKIANVETVIQNHADTNNNYLNSKLRIFTTYTNNVVQEFNNQAVDMFLVENNVIDLEQPLNPDEFVLDLNQTYTVALKFYTDNTKSTVIEIPSTDDNYWITNIRITENSLLAINRILLYDDNQLLTIYDEFELETDYTYWRVKNINTGDFISIGKNPTSDSALTMTEIIPGQLVLVEFLNENEEVVDQLVFVIHDSDRYKEFINGTISGNLLNGYRVTLNKLDIEVLLVDIAENEIRIIDDDGNIVGSLHHNPNNPGAINVSQGYIDTITENQQNIYFDFSNFATSNGNILSIYQNRNKENLYLDITTFTKLVKLTKNFSEEDYQIANQYEIDYIDLTNDDRNMVIKPILSGTINSVSAIRPVYLSKLTNSSEVLLTELNAEKSIKYTIDENSSVLINVQRIGLNRYYYHTTNGIYYIDIVIKKDLNNNLYIDTINGNPIT